MNKKHFTWIFCGLVFLLPKGGSADELKRNLFVLGVQIGEAECISSLFEPFSTKDKPGAFDLIKRNVDWSLNTSRAMGNPANSLATLKSDLSKLTTTLLVDALSADIDKDASFLSMLNQLGVIRETWQGEVMAQPPF